MATPLDLYFEEIDSNVAEIETLISGGPNHGELKKIIKSMDDTLKQAMREGRMAEDPSGELKAKLEVYKGKVGAKKAEAERAMLIGEDTGEARKGKSVGKSAEDKKRLENVNDKLMKQSETLDRCHNIVNETEAVGVDILNELGENREKLEGVQDKSKEMDGMLDDASTRMKRMQRREDMGGCSIS